MEHRIVSRDEWLEVRRALLGKEKEFTRLRDRLSEERRNLPWVRVDKEYVFAGPNGKVTLAQVVSQFGLVGHRANLCLQRERGAVNG